MLRFLLLVLAAVAGAVAFGLLPNPLLATQNPFNPANPISRTFGPGTVAPIGVGGHFPPDIAHTPPVDLFNIELQSRDGLTRPGRMASRAPPTTSPWKTGSTCRVHSCHRATSPRRKRTECNPESIPMLRGAGLRRCPAEFP